MNLYTKITKASSKNYYSNLLEKQKENGIFQIKYQSLPTATETENRIISDKNAISEEFNTLDFF